MMHESRWSLAATVLASMFAAAVVVGCAAEASPPPAHTESVGAAVVASHAEGANVVSAISSDKTGDTLTITFDATAHAATLAPKYGQPKKVVLDAVPADVEAANRFVADALSRGNDAAHGQPGSGGVTPKTYEPPPADCLHTCYGVCDDAFPNECQNAVCRFGCYVGCTSK